MARRHAGGGEDDAAAPRVVLGPLGLGVAEEEIYRLLVDRPGLTRERLRALLGRGSTRGLDARLRAMVEQGLIVEDGAGTYRAGSPPLALGPLLAGRQEELRQAEAAVAMLTEHFRATNWEVPGTPVELVVGREAVARRFLQIQLAAREELMAFMPVHRQRRPPVVAAADNTAEEDAIRRGVRYRIAMERAWLDLPGSEELMEQVLRSDQEVVLVDAVPVQVLIADRRIAMAPLAPDDEHAEPAATVIHESGLVTALTALFEMVVAGGMPLGTHDPVQQPELEELDLVILQLLRSGMTDVGIARHSGVAPRSVQRRIQRIMALAGAHSRFQLGAHAVAAGWLAREPG